MDGEEECSAMDGEGEGSGVDGQGEGSRAGVEGRAVRYGRELSQEERHGVVMGEIAWRAKTNGEFIEGTARMVQDLLQSENSPNQIGPMLQSAILYFTGVNMKKELKMAFARKTVKCLAVGITKLDGDQLIAAILQGPCMCVGANESLRNGDKKYPIFVSFWDVAAGAPWWGCFRVCTMKDETAEAQACLFYETIVDVLKYPRERVLYVLADNTASVSGEIGGCVTLLQRKLKGEDTAKKIVQTRAVRGRGGARGRGAASRGRGGVGRGGRGEAARGGRGGAARGGGGQTGGCQGGQGGSRRKRGGSVGADEQG